MVCAFWYGIKNKGEVEYAPVNLYTNNSPFCNELINKKGRPSYRTATTFCPCSGQGLGEFKGSWSYDAYPGAKVFIFVKHGK